MIDNATKQQCCWSYWIIRLFTLCRNYSVCTRALIKTWQRQRTVKVDPLGICEILKIFIVNQRKYSIYFDGFHLTDRLKKKNYFKQTENRVSLAKEIRYKFTVYYIDVTVIIIETFKSTYLEKNALNVHYVPC